MNYRLTILFFFFTPLIFGQTNLVPNGDFELGPDSTSAEWLYWVDNACTYSDSIGGPTFWTVVNISPDRLIEGDIPCEWDNDTAQSGKAYIVLGNFGGDWGESGKTVLLSPLQKDSLYHLSYYLSLETVCGTRLDSSRVAIVFNNNGDSLPSPYVTVPLHWQYFDTIFSATTYSTELKIINIEPVWSLVKIDNVSLFKISNAQIDNNYMTKNNIKIYPNPATNELTIDLTSPDKYFFDLFDLLGTKRLSARLDSSSKTVDLTSVDSGVYVFTIVDDKGDIIKTDKLIIIK